MKDLQGRTESYQERRAISNDRNDDACVLQPNRGARTRKTSLDNCSDWSGAEPPARLVRLLSGPSIGGLSLWSRFDFILVQKRLPRVVTLFIRVFGIIALIVTTGDVLQIVQRELAHGQ